ncbi:hypothetical protein [Methylocella silvestris]|uniref:hypothetical protein n=1 Tax=Methylocella silvestris TaxID=199596 RepID=UPI0011AF27F4|nr:hypothetical protein [Methylocella silvestris]
MFFGFALTAAAKTSASASTKASSIHALALTADHGLIATGIVAAVGSVSFAAVMISTDNSRPLFGGVEHLMIFAQPIGGSHKGSDAAQGSSQKHPVDYSATGSIDHSKQTGPAAGAMNRGEASAAAPTGVLKGYVVKFSTGGSIVVQSPKGSFAAAPGASLPDVGRILSIENRNGRWVVVTERGAITESY